ncbi:MAG: hypothetical protein LBT00_03670, partial [Spirochaetaceae bacterium]|nr:hypothetical protein [Spirochaetaceae bacterium]
VFPLASVYALRYPLQRGFTTPVTPPNHGEEKTSWGFGTGSVVCNPPSLRASPGGTGAVT